MNKKEEEKFDEIIHLLNNIEKLLVHIIAKDNLPTVFGLTEKHVKDVRFNVLLEGYGAGIED